VGFSPPPPGKEKIGKQRAPPLSPPPPPPPPAVPEARSCGGWIPGSPVFWWAQSGSPRRKDWPDPPFPGIRLFLPGPPPERKGPLPRWDRPNPPPLPPVSFFFLPPQRPPPPGPVPQRSPVVIRPSSPGGPRLFFCGRGPRKGGLKAGKKVFAPRSPKPLPCPPFCPGLAGKSHGGGGPPPARKRGPGNKTAGPLVRQRDPPKRGLGGPLLGSTAPRPPPR